MPTGYTAGILSNPNADFAEFVWHCAKAMCVYNHGRGAGDLDYYREALVKAKQQNQENLAAKDWDARFEQYLQTEKERIAAQQAEEAQMRANLLRILSFVERIQPPTPAHVPLWDFMRDQIRQTMEFDCPLERPSYQLEFESALQFQANALRKSVRNVAYLEEQVKTYEEALQRSDLWREQLNAAVPSPLTQGEQ